MQIITKRHQFILEEHAQRIANAGNGFGEIRLIIRNGRVRFIEPALTVEIPPEQYATCVNCQKTTGCASCSVRLLNEDGC